MNRAGKIALALLAVALLAGAGALWFVTLPWRLAFRVAVGGKPKGKTTAALVEATLALLLSALGLAWKGKSISRDKDYLDGIERGMAAARRSAGHEDGRIIEGDRLAGRATP